MPEHELDRLIAEQVAYYRARAAEYDATAPLGGWPRARLVEALEAFRPRGHVLELACGTGQWTAELVKHATSVTAVDASPEMIELNRARLAADSVRYLEADLFRWVPAERYDVVFFSAWLSHVPPQRFEEFWALVAGCLSERGRVFFIDELPAVAAHERLISETPAPAVQRALESGRLYRAVKVLHEPSELRDRLAELGWTVDVKAVGWRFFYASASRTTPDQARGVSEASG